MLVLFETAAGFAVFKLLDEKKLKKTENLFEEFENPEKANKVVQLQEFRKFIDSAEALQAGVALNEGKICKPLKKLLKKIFVDDVQEQLMVWDPKLGNSIKEKLGVQVISSGATGELMRCIKSQVEALIPGLQERDLAAMSLGLAHNLARYKLKFSPDKVDTMIVQAVSLLDDIDKELNNYVMRAREWYGWHFPELSKILTDNYAYIRSVLHMGTREKAATTDFSDILSEEMEEKVKEAAEVSMGTEIADDDIANIHSLCEQIVELTEYRTQLYEYLKNRMHAIAPNLNILVGELVGARLIAHAGSLLNLAKHPASTIQILGAEKALFRALKTRKSTPKYGLIYHAQMVGQSSVKNKGKMSRMLAAKAALAIRYDALGEETNTDMGIDNRTKLAARMRVLESGYTNKISGLGKSQAKFESYQNTSEVSEYYDAADSTLASSSKRKFDDSYEAPKAKKFKVECAEDGDTKVTEEETNGNESFEKKKKKKDKKVKEEEPAEEQESLETPKKKKKKVKQEVEEEEDVAAVTPINSEKKKKKKAKQEVEEEEEVTAVTPVSSEKKKKKKVKQEEEEEEMEVVSAESEKKKKKKKVKKEMEELD